MSPSHAERRGGSAAARRRALRTVLIVALSLVLVAVMVLVALRLTAPKPVSPDFYFDVSTADYSGADTVYHDQANPVEIDCLGLTRADLEAALPVADYTVNIDWGTDQNPTGVKSCWFAAEGPSTVLGTSTFGVSLAFAPAGNQSNSEDQWRAAFGSDFVYTFPDSFGWGGALWTSGGQTYDVPATPGPDNYAFAVLCDAQGNCLSVSAGKVSMGQNQPKKPDPWTLNPNANGVFDPLGAVISMLETSWQALHTEKPDLVPTALPTVNPSPYQPLTAEPFASDDPGGEPT